MTADDLIKKILDYLNNNNTYTTNSYSIGFGSEIGEISSQLQKLKDTLNFMNDNFEELSDTTRKQLEQEKKYLEELNQIKDKKNKKEKEINKILDKQRKELEKQTKNDTSKIDSEGNLNKEGKKQVEEQKRQNELSKYFGSDAASKIQNSKLAQTYNVMKGAKGGGMGGKAVAVIAVANVIGEAVSAISNAITDYQLKDIEKQKESVAYQYDVLKKTFAAHSKLATKQLEIQSKIVTNHLSGVTAFLTKGVKESAFGIANSALEINSDLLKYKFDKYFTEQNLQQELFVRSEENRRTMNRLDREQTQGIVDNVTGAVDSLTGGIIGGVTGAIKTLIGNRNRLLAAEDTVEVLRLNSEMEYVKQMRDFVQESLNKMTDTLQGLAKQGLEFTSNIEDIGLRIDKNIREGMATFGYTNYYNYKDTMQKLTKSLSVITSEGKTFYLDKTDDDIIKSQSDYVYNTGRNIEMSEGDAQKSFLMSELWDENTVNSLTGQMDYFNHSIEDSVDMFYEMYQTANKMGISNKKYAETLNKNLKLAQKYTFNGGTKGLMKMALWAEKTRFNMNSLDSMISKIQEGGLEGTIKQAAQLQVLGGSAAMGADPLAMQYEAWSDPEAFAKRMYDMTKEYASFNSETGEVDIKGLNAMMVANIAKAQGRSPEDLRAELTQRVKNEQIDSQIGNLGLTDSQKQLLYSKAQYDKEDGKWKININGEKKDINNLSESDFDHIAPIEMDIKDYVFEIYNLLKQQDGATKYSSTQLGFDTLNSTTSNIQERIENSLNWFDKHSSELKTIVEEGSKWVTEEQKTYQNLLVNNADNFETALSTLTTDTEKLQEAINDACENIQTFSSAISAKTEKEMLNMLSPYLEKLGITVEDFNADNSARAHRKGIVQAYHNNQVNSGVFERNDWPEVVQNALALHNKIQTLLDEGTFKRDSPQYAELLASEEWKAVMTLDSGDDLETKFSIQNREDVEPQMVQDIVESILEVNNETSDSIMYSNGSSMLTSASNITPIKDGSVQLAQSDPQDVALFAKTGGPFDTLFNGIFAKINEISNVLPRSMEYIMPLERTINEINHSKGTANNSKIQIDTIKIELNGRLELSNSNGQSVDILNEIKNNPILLRTLTQLISETIEKNINGGRAAYTGGIVTPRFN